MDRPQVSRMKRGFSGTRGWSTRRLAGFASAVVIVAGLQIGVERADATPTGVIAFSSSRCDDAADAARRPVVKAPAPPTPTEGVCRPAIWLVNDDGSGLHRLTEGGPGGDPYGADTTPAWSPDGSVLAYSSADREGVSLVVRPLGGPAVTVVRGLSVFAPAWSRDGRTLFYTSNQNACVGCSYLFRVGLVDRQPRQLTVGRVGDYRPVPIPGSDSVAVVRDLSSPNGVLPSGPPGTSWPTGPTVRNMAIVAVDPATGRETPLTFGEMPQDAGDIAFSPDGRYLGFLTISGLFVVSAPSGRVSQRDSGASWLAWSSVGPSLLYSKGTGRGVNGWGEALTLNDVTRPYQPARAVTDGTSADFSASWRPLVPNDVLKPVLDHTPPGIALLTKVSDGPGPRGAARGRRRVRFIIFDPSGIRSAKLAVARRLRSGRCRFHDGRRFGASRSCIAPPMSTVRNATAWRTRAARLPRGAYDLFLRATDGRGNTTRKAKRFRIRVS